MWCLKRTTWCKKSYKMHYVVQKKAHQAHSHKSDYRKGKSRPLGDRRPTGEVRGVRPSMNGRALGHGNDRHNCHSKGNRRHNLERLAQMPFKGKSPACLGNCLEMLTIPVVLVPKAVVYESVAIMSCFK